MTYTIVGVTGHIDHGKSTLVRVLTGVDTDTHPEEKRRGITIDLGFASFSEGPHRFALIDAPGHQKYIGNLLAGVSAIEIGLLVVACDQGIQRQTLEHAAVVKALGVRHLVVAISRIDLASDSTLADLTEELQLFLSDLGFDEVPIVAYSAVTGVGIDQLKKSLCDYASSLKTNNDEKRALPDFRLPVDRIFIAPGRGLVAAGTIWSGEVCVGDPIELAGTNQVLRVRELEVHGASVKKSVTGYRTAINLVGTGHVKIQRGDELVTPGTHPQSHRLVVAFNLFADAKEFRCPATMQMHSATHSCEARILGAKRVLPGTQTIVVVEPELPIVATYQQACLFRRPYPVGPLAGGRILAAVVGQATKTKDLVQLGCRLQAAPASARLLAWVDVLGEVDLMRAQHASQLAFQVGIAYDQLESAIQTLVQDKSVLQVGKRLVSIAIAQQVRLSIQKLIEDRAQHADNAWIVETSIAEQLRAAGSVDLIAWTIDRLVDEKAIVRSHKLIAIASEQTTLSKKQRKNMESIIGLFAGTRSPPTLKEAAAQLHLSVASASSLMRFATQQGTFVDLEHGFFISRQVFGRLCQELQSLFTKDEELSVATIRDQWQVTRKHAIPLLEYCDREKFTIRHENLRVAGPALSSLEQVIEQA